MGAVVDGVWTALPFLAEQPDEERRAFVAVDLLELGGEPLLDVPLQERRRLLESIVDEIESRGIKAANKETYKNGVRKVTFRDPDGNEIGFGGAPLEDAES